MLTRTVALSALLCLRVHGQELTLTLDEALRIAQGKSEQVAIARAGVNQARGEQIRARSQRLPQINGFAGYTRTLATQFSGIFDNANQGPVCPPLSVDASLPVTDRVSELERFLACGGSAGPSFGGGGALPFGRTNIWTAGLSFSQALYAGGRLVAQERVAEALRETAEIQVDSNNAQFVLDITQAFYDTALTFQLLVIAQSNLEEATRTLEFVRLGRQVGRLPEFDVLRAEVTRRNQLPEIARRRAALEQSILRLRQLLELAPDVALRIDADLLSPTLAVPAAFLDEYREAQPLRLIDDRAPVRQADALVRQRRATLDIARSQRLPAISAVSDYALIAYPTRFIPTSTNQFRNDWTVGLSLQLPIFVGGRIRGDIVSAEAGVDEAVAQRRLTRELAQLDTRVVVDQLRSSEEEWRASLGTIEQAERALDIARTRYRAGISNQLEVDDARIALLTARAERAQAARNLQVARVTLSLLPYLPVNTTAQVPGQPLIPSRTQQPQPANPFQTNGTLPATPRTGTLQPGVRPGGTR